jgi:ABC-type multidrug transport system ATPase subunit
VVQALLDDPQVLIVDEPTVGLDPEERVRLRSYLADLSAERIVLLSTHIVSDVESVASHLYVVRNGRLVLAGSPAELIESMRGKVWQLEVAADQYPAIRQRFVVTGSVRRYDRVTVRVVDGLEPDAVAEPVPPNLEDAYMYHSRPDPRAC